MNLVDRVSKELTAVSPELNERFKKDLASEGPWSAKTDSDISKLNSYLRCSLTQLDRDTSEERDYLCESTDERTWLKHFKKNILSPLVNEVYKHGEKS